MISAADVARPVSRWLEAEIREWTRKQGIVVWLDLDEHYSGFINSLIAERAAGRLPYDVHAFRGSHLELLLSLDGVAAGADKPQLVLHLPGFNEETVKETPLYELYEAGTRYRKALTTAVTEAAAGQVLPDRITAFTSQSGLTLDAADSWLAGQLEERDDSLAARLRRMPLGALVADLLGSGPIASCLGDARDAATLWERLAASTGLPDLWRRATLPESTTAPADVAFAVASWVLAVEYVDDLKRLPVNAQLGGIRNLPRAVIDACRGLASQLREQPGDFYQRTADETEALIADEVEVTRAEDLGATDTFRFEEDKILKAALAALAEAKWDAALAWARTRVDPSLSSAPFWLKRDPARLNTWQLVAGAAQLGNAIASAGPRLEAHGGLEAAVDAYVSRGAAVDGAHRRLEQRRAALLFPQLPEFEALRTRLDEMRAAWRQWADAWARDFNALCRAHGFLPAASHQQRALFDDVIRPLTQEPGTTALFVVDAFRYEMGEELYRELAGAKATTAQLQARLAELPTVTAVGMNALAPVSVGGRLTPVASRDGSGISGFSARDFRVSDPETRKRAMHDRVGGAACPWLTLEEVIGRDGTSLKRTVAQARLVVVHSQEIDLAGEKGVGPVVFGQVMQKLRAAWHLLREAGVRRFVFTSDHGFLLLDQTAATAQAHGRPIDPSRRHVIALAAADHAREVRVALADLGYEGASGDLIMPETTAVFDTGRRATTFVHGGNSLQERVIPVLTVVHRAAAGGSTIQYAIAAVASEDVAGMQCLEAKVDVIDQGALDFGSTREIEIGLRVPEIEGVQVELCQTRGGARLDAGAVHAVVGERFELFFRLAGPSDARVQVELHHPGAEASVRPFRTEERFSVTSVRTALQAPVAPAPAVWLQQFADPGVRQVFAHLAEHGVVTEAEAASMLGGARGLRRFAVQFEVLVAKAPFGVRIDAVAGVKRYIREGRSQ